MSVKKLPRLGGVIVTGALCGNFAAAMATTIIGDPEQLSYLNKNKSAITSGEAPMDKPPTGLTL